MAEGYAARLTKGVNYGVCGLPENYDTERQLKKKKEAILSLIKNSKYLVVFTGAGISTASGIPDFRGWIGR